MNNNTIEKLQLNEVKELIKVYCVSSLGKELIENLTPSKNIGVINFRLMENKEARNILTSSNHIPLEGLFNINVIIDKIEKNMILEPIELVKVQDFLRGCKKIKSFMIEKEFYAKTLSSYALNITECDFIESEINYTIKNNKIDSNASKELKRIRRSIEICEDRIKEKLNKFITSSNNKRYIQEFIITKRGDRYAIPIKSSYKNEVDGSILDTSSKGNTVFIEPSSVSKFSTELIMLKSEESIEEYKILSYLTELMFEKIIQIKLNLEIIANYDMIFAKAKYSLHNNCITPIINNNGYINIKKGKHPLLKGNIVPLDFEIGEAYRSLIITGPNAGGKTLSLKTVGLLTMMVQCGFDISAAQNTEISIFENIFVDIGDNQSIENALSTFSSHIKNIADIINNSNNQTLVILDEIGSGTEPNEGACLAISILEEFYSMGCITIASTHYGEIKNFASMHKDFENAGMLFDKDTLEPLYKLVIGKSEDSNALFISKKMGIKNKILDRARSYMSDKNYNVEVIKKHREKINKKLDNKQNEMIEDTTKDNIIFEVGDKVKILDKDDYAIVYKEVDKFNNVQVLYKDEFIEINIKKLNLCIKAKELYPVGYDIESLFTSYQERKLEKDIKRGSKKALKKIQKEIRKNKE